MPRTDAGRRPGADRWCRVRQQLGGIVELPVVRSSRSRLPLHRMRFHQGEGADDGGSPDGRRTGPRIPGGSRPDLGRRQDRRQHRQRSPCCGQYPGRRARCRRRLRRRHPAGHVGAARPHRTASRRRGGSPLAVRRHARTSPRAWGSSGDRRRRGTRPGAVGDPLGPRRLRRERGGAADRTRLPACGHDGLDRRRRSGHRRLCRNRPPPAGW